MSDAPRPDLSPAAFFADLADAGLPGGLWPEDGRPVWEALGDGLSEALADAVTPGIQAHVPAGAHIMEEDGAPIHIAADVTIEPGAVVYGPAWIGPGASLRAHAYLRGGVVLGAGATVGHASEVKGSILLPGATAAHLNYVGDSILGRDVNLGAGTILSNLKNVPGNVIVPLPDGDRVDSGLRKFGAILGDGVRTGCNAVLNPGTLMGPGALCYPNASVRAGWYGAGTVIKLRQEQPRGRLRRDDD